MPENKSIYYIMHNGIDFGAKTLEQVREWSITQRIDTTTLCRKNNSQKYESITKFPEFSLDIKPPETSRHPLPSIGETPPRRKSFFMHEYYIIPQSNPMARKAIAWGILSLIPIAGFLMGFLAVSFGIKGLQAYKEKPEIKGSYSALIGIVLGIATIILWGLSIIAIFVGVVCS